MGAAGSQDSDSAGTGARAVVALIGFATRLGDTLADFYRERGFEVMDFPSTAHATEMLRYCPADLIVAFGSFHANGIHELLETLGSPRRTRIIVMLPAPDPELERRYHALGIHVVLPMPVSPAQLLPELETRNTSGVPEPAQHPAA